MRYDSVDPVYMLDFAGAGFDSVLENVVGLIVP